MESNEKEDVCYPQPTTLAQRVEDRQRLRQALPLRAAALVDPIENPANAAYAGWPERFYILDEAGTIVYKGKPGPFGYHPEEVEAWLAKRFPDRQRARRPA